jgi:hypothetical protein
MANVQWTKVGMEGIVQQSLVDGEVHRWVHFGAGGGWAGLRLGRSLRGRLLLSRVRKRRVGGRWMRVGCQVQPVYVAPEGQPRGRTVMIRVDMPWMYSMHWPVTVVPRGILTTRPAADMVQEGATAQVYLSLRKTDCALRHSGSARGQRSWGCSRGRNALLSLLSGG